MLSAVVDSRLDCPAHHSETKGDKRVHWAVSRGSLSCTVNVPPGLSDHSQICDSTHMLITRAVLARVCRVTSASSAMLQGSASLDLGDKAEPLQDKTVLASDITASETKYTGVSVTEVTKISALDNIHT
jgi:hypothetical protein